MISEELKELIKDIDFYTSYPEYGDNREIALAALEINGEHFSHMSNTFKDDKELLLKAMEDDVDLLTFASQRLKSDKEVIITAVQKKSWTFVFADDSLKNDKNFCKEIMSIDVFCHMSPDFRKDKDLLLQLLNKDANYLGVVFDMLDDNIKDDNEVLFKSIKYVPSNIKLFLKKLDDKILKDIIHLNPLVLYFLEKNQNEKHNLKILEKFLKSEDYKNNISLFKGYQDWIKEKLTILGNYKEQEKMELSMTQTIEDKNLNKKLKF
jgi:hypothetical protein